jgi:hypothetical protein
MIGPVCNGVWNWGLRVAVLALAAGLVATLACGGGVSKTEYDAVKSQLAQEQQKGSALQQQLSSKVQEASQTQQKVTAREADLATAQAQVAAKEKEIVALKEKPAGSGLPAGGTILLAAKPVPSPTPRPTATPLPAGATPAPRPTPPASYYEPLALYVYADTVTAGPNESKYNIDATGIKAASCVITGVFARGMHLVWRFEVVDASTGKRLTDADVASAAVRLPDGTEIKGRFGRHGSTDTSPWFWTAAWDVPLDYPLGALDWTIAVSTKDGKTGAFKLWTVSIPDRGIESRTQIVDSL